MTEQQVRVSIGIPVYNGENYLEAAIESILAQTFTEFELIISDNASIDRTEAICRAYAAKDSRIRYYRNDRNIGAAPNYNRLVPLARGEYFKWAAHDDVLHPEFLQQCVAALDQHPDVVCAYPWTQVIDQKGVPVPERYEYDGTIRLGSDKPHERFHDIACTFQMCYSIFGLYRLSTLRSLREPLNGSYGHSDGVLLARLVLVGSFYEVPEYLFFSRRHDQQFTQVHMKANADQDYFQAAGWFDTSKAGKILLPRWLIFTEYCRAIWEAKISMTEKLACCRSMAVWVNRYWTHMIRDIPVAVAQVREQLLRSLSNRQPASNS